MQWTEVTVLTTTQGSEMVSAILEQAGSKGVMIEDKNDVYANQRPEGQWDIIDEAIAERIGDDVRVTGYYPVDEHLESAMAAIREGLSGLRAQNLPFDLGNNYRRPGRLSEQVFFQSFGVSENRIGTFFRNSRIGLENKLKISFSGLSNHYLVSDHYPNLSLKNYQTTPDL